MAKVAKSIRIEPRVYEYIEKYKGEGFNEKFENIILDAMESEKKRLEQIKYLDKEIETKRQSINKLSEDLRKRRGIMEKLESIFRLTEQIEKDLK